MFNITKQVLRFITISYNMPRSKKYDVDIVIEKAMYVFWENGYKSTSVRMLEKEMEINQFSIYSSFKDKHNLFIESLRKYQEHVRTHRFANLLKEDSGLKDIEEFFLDLSKNINSDKFSKGCLIVNTAGEIGEQDELIAKEVSDYFTFIKEMFKRILIRSRENGEISHEANVEKYSNYLLGIMQSLSLGGKVLQNKQLKDFISMALICIK